MAIGIHVIRASIKAFDASKIIFTRRLLCWLGILPSNRKGINYPGYICSTVSWCLQNRIRLVPTEVDVGLCIKKMFWNLVFLSHARYNPIYIVILHTSCQHEVSRGKCAFGA